MAVLAIPVFFPFLARISAIFGWLRRVILTPYALGDVVLFLSSLLASVSLVGPSGAYASDGSGRFVSVKGDSLLAPNQGLFLERLSALHLGPG